MKIWSFCVSSALVVSGMAAEHPGKAVVEWVSAGESWQAGGVVRTAIRMKIDEGWHTYWSNPGEGGMKLSVKWTLPEGWTAGDVMHPVPMHIMTGDLPGFGYEGEVVFPVELKAHAKGGGEVTLVADVSWLACDEASCVPGREKLELVLAEGEAKDGPGAVVISEAMKRVPVVVEGVDLKVREVEGGMELRLGVADGVLIDPSKAETFPETPRVVDAATLIRWEKSGDGWLAVVPKNEYAEGAVEELTLVLAGQRGVPISVSWKAE